MKTFLLTLLAILFNEKDIETSGPSNWGYATTNNSIGPSEWKTNFPSCGGKRQSPIDIQTKSAIYVQNMLPISIKKLNNNISEVSLEKHPTSLYLNFNDNWKLTFGEDKCLKPVAIHWHWGSNNNQGSEHYLNGRQYPLEGHLVSYNCQKYSSINDSKSSDDGLYVIGVFYKIGESNSVLQNVLSKMPINSNKIPEIGPDEILPKQLDKYYQYDGSLTTPPCTENVRWTILNEELTVSNAQLDILRKLEFDPPNTGNMKDNFRPIITNPQNERPIQVSFKSGLMLKFKREILLMEIISIFYVMF